MLVNLSKRKKAVTELNSQIAALQHQIADYDRRIQLMTQKQSTYTKYFSKPKKQTNSKSDRIATKITDEALEEKQQEENIYVPQIVLENENEDKPPLLANAHHLQSSGGPVPPSGPRSSKSPRSRIPVPKNLLDSI